MASEELEAELRETARSFGFDIVKVEELAATQEMASQMGPWKNEAERLAQALYAANPAHPILRDEVWRPLVEKLSNPQFGWEPDAQSASLVANSVTDEQVAEIARRNEEEDRTELERREALSREDTLDWLESEASS